VAAVAMFLLMPVAREGSNEMVFNFVELGDGRAMVHHINILKCSVALICVLLYGRIYQLVYQKREVVVENERLKNENMKARYTTLMNQINPHFLFNSLNSLAMLVREKKTEDALLYIERLSETFRYTIQNDADTTATSLAGELEFAEAYKYLLEVRYADKLFIDMDIEENKLEWKLPPFSIQPLIENAVKHNSITKANPLHVKIYTQGDYLVVENPIIPKISSGSGIGIGLDNLDNRWQLLTGRHIEILNDGKTFKVRLPFISKD
jgi:LytS/YehU family sensor histidine kinase